MVEKFCQVENFTKKFPISHNPKIRLFKANNKIKNRYEMKNLFIIFI